MDNSMVSIPVGYVAIPLKERDSLMKSNELLIRECTELEKRIRALKEMCLEEAKDHPTGSYKGSVYVTNIAKLFGFSIETAKGDEDGAD